MVAAAGDTDVLAGVGVDAAGGRGTGIGGMFGEPTDPSPGEKHTAYGFSWTNKPKPSGGTPVGYQASVRLTSPLRGRPAYA